MFSYNLYYVKSHGRKENIGYGRENTVHTLPGRNGYIGKNMLGMISDEEMFAFFQHYAEINGAVSLGNAVNDLYKDVTPRPVEKVKAKLESTGRFIVYKSEGGNLTVRLNPNYKPISWREKHWLQYDIIKALITAIFSIVVGLLLFELKGQNNGQLNQQQFPKKSLTDSSQTHEDDSLIK